MMKLADRLWGAAAKGGQFQDWNLLTDAAEEIDRLLATEAKLPKDRHGTPLVPGMAVKQKTRGTGVIHSIGPGSVLDVSWPELNRVGRVMSRNVEAAEKRGTV